MLKTNRLLRLLLTTATLATTFGHEADAASSHLTPAATASLASIFAPSGTLRVSINLGNPILANQDPKTGQPVGVSVDLATELAKRLGVPLHLVAVASAHLSVENVEQDRADVGFFAIDPKRGQAIQFTKPYVLIEGVYAVRADSPIKTLEQVDQPGVTVATSKGSAYDLFLTRELQRATIVRVTTSQGVVQGFLDQHLSVASGIRQQLEKDAARVGGLKILEPHFMVIRQAMGVPKAKGDEAAAYLSGFVEEMKTSGFVAASLARHHISGAGVAKGDD
ncbi:ABC transporter substrate-binding protein [Pseudomonas sp.]|uniref:ABC transporter substrate-binding protein n=1 Tax=Pseudomonas sp. TaxID=306 RepID=UPI0026392817|nr:ABC transporter substrate-binding protein [Pseudomonas sp.]